jgi:signal recognition particle subunit SRP54
VIMLAGLQGAGKTTLAGKLGRWLKAQGNTPLLVACDLQRPNAVQQLQVVGERAGVPVFAPQPGSGVGDPVEVARQSLDEAKHQQYNMVVIDTAGRTGVDAEMMAQAVAIRDAVQPDEVLFVVDAMIGQDAVATAQAFLDGVGYDAVVLTKLDGDARGGAALSIAELTGRPIMFASTGEKLEDFDLFHPDRMASRILDMGDVLTLIEQAEKAFDIEQSMSLAGRLTSGEGITLEDFVEQLAMVRKMGPIGNLLGMLPGMGEHREALSQVDDKSLDRVEAIVRSMTPEERRNPKIINGSRRLRIANGSGVAVGEVSQLTKNFFEAQRQMKQAFAGGIPGMPGMGRRAAKSSRGKKGKKGGGRATSGGNRALPAGQAGQPGGQAAPATPAAANNPFGQGGFGGLPEGFDLSESLANLPKTPPPGLANPPQSNVPAAFRGKRPKKK